MNRGTVRVAGGVVLFTLSAMVALVAATAVSVSAQGGDRVASTTPERSVDSPRSVERPRSPRPSGAFAQVSGGLFGVRVGGCGGYPGLGVGGVLVMGDSYSAGEGLDCYQSGTDQSDNQCHRSDFAYSGYVLGGLGHRFVACSSAWLRDVLTQAQGGRMGFRILVSLRRFSR